MITLIVAGLVAPMPGDAHHHLAPTAVLPADMPVTALPGQPSLDADSLYLSPAVDPSRPVPVVIALHGYAGSGKAIVARLRTCADQYGWLVIGPTMAYRDYFDPAQLRSDARDNLPRVHAMLDAVRAGANGLEIQPRVVLYGFSRGAQMAHHFSMAYASEVRAVAALSAGSYTLPEAADRSHGPMLFPFGVADLSDIGLPPSDPAVFSSIPFWVGVGGDDINPGDTSRAWDAYEGQTRVDRATAFASHVQNRGNRVELHVFSGAAHEETGSMRTSACAFLASQVD